MCELNKSVEGRSFSNPAVSIIVPAYNAEPYIEETLKSIQSQTFEDYEVIVVDDCSTDETASIAADFESDTRFKTIRRDANGGVSAAQNTGLREARGEWVALIGSDDAWMPDKLERQFALLADHPDASLVFANGVEFDESGELGAFYNERRKFPSGDVLSRLLQCNCLWASSVMVKRQSLLQVDGFDENLSVGEDYFVWMKILAGGGEAIGVWEPIVKYRKRKGSLTGNKVRAYRDLEYIHQCMLISDLSRAQVSKLKRSIKRDRRDKVIALARQTELSRREMAAQLLKAWLCFPHDLKPIIFMLYLIHPRGLAKLEGKLARKW